MKVRFVPSIAEMRRRWSEGEPSGPVHYMVGEAAALENIGIEVVDDGEAADLVQAHGVVNVKADVLFIPAVWLVDQFPEHPAFWDEQNSIIADAMAQAREVVVESRFTARNANKLWDRQIRVFPQAWDDKAPHRKVDWHVGLKQKYIAVWPKTGVGPWCDPRPAIHLARERRDCSVFLMTTEKDTVEFAGKLPENVRCLGPLDPSVFRGLLLEADVFLETSPASSGQAYLEALGAGVPVLGFDWGGVPEVVDERCAVLVTPGDERAYVKGFDRILDRRMQMSKAAKRCAAAYTWDKTVKHYQTLYEELTK